MSKLFKFKDSKDLQLKNMHSIFTTEDVFILFKSSDVNEVQP